MLGDRRLGGVVPGAGPIAPRSLSRERTLAVRLSSPHESNDTLKMFLDKIDKASAVAWRDYWRLNYACAVQPSAANRMPGIVDVCKEITAQFWPERIRVIQLAPQQSGVEGETLGVAEVDKLRSCDVEVLTIDARRSTHPAEPGNVRILADYFDFS